MVQGPSYSVRVKWTPKLQDSMKQTNCAQSLGRRLLSWATAVTVVLACSEPDTALRPGESYQQFLSPKGKTKSRAIKWKSSGWEHSLENAKIFSGIRWIYLNRNSSLAKHSSIGIRGVSRSQEWVVFGVLDFPICLQACLYFDTSCSQMYWQPEQELREMQTI